MMSKTEVQVAWVSLSQQNSGLGKIPLASEGGGWKRLRTVWEFVFQRQEAQLLVVECPSPTALVIDAIRLIRNVLGAGLPIFVLTEHTSEDLTVGVLEAGADECVQGPVGQMELRARVLALARRAGSEFGRVECRRLAVRDYELVPDCREIRFRGKPLALSPKEFDLAVLLFGSMGRLLSRFEIEVALWGREHPPSSRALDTAVCRLRKKLDLSEATGVVLEAVHSKGYRLQLAGAAEMI